MAEITGSGYHASGRNRQTVQTSCEASSSFQRPGHSPITAEFTLRSPSNGHPSSSQQSQQHILLIHFFPLTRVSSVIFVLSSCSSPTATMTTLTPEGMWTSPRSLLKRKTSMSQPRHSHVCFDIAHVSSVTLYQANTASMAQLK